MWTHEQVGFVFLDEPVRDRWVALEVGTPSGRLGVIGNVHFEGRTLAATGVHMHGVGVGPNELGIGALRCLADILPRELDFDALVVEGAVRTTGADPGARPRPVRFTRRAVASAVRTAGGIDLRSLQNWESGRRQPDTATRSYIKVIRRLPRETSEALESGCRS